MKTNNLKSVEGYAVSFVAAVLAILIALSLAGMAKAGGVCRQRVVSYQQYAAPLLAPVYYQIGQSVQRESVDTQQFRHSEEYDELQRLRAYREGVEHAAIIAQGNSGDRPSGPPQPATGHPAATEEDLPAPPAAPTELPPPSPTGNLRWDAFRARYPVTAAMCSSCHGRKDPDNPDGDLFLNGDMSLDGDDGALRKFAMLKKVYNGHMPPKKPLDDATYSAFQAEMLAEVDQPPDASPNP